MGLRAGRMRHLATRVGMSAAAATAVLALAVVASDVLAQSQKGEAVPAGKDMPPPEAKAKVKLGLSINDPRAFRGYTLLNPMSKKTAYLMDMEGRVVKTWESKYNSMHAAYLLENGHLFRIAVLEGGERAFGGGPGSAGRIQEFAWDGDLVWDFEFHNDKQYPHHDAAKMPNGNVLMIVWDKKSKDEAIAAGRKPELVSNYVLPDSIVEIKPTGKTTGEVVWEWHLWDHLVQDQDSTKANYGDVAAIPSWSTSTSSRARWAPVPAGRPARSDRQEGRPAPGRDQGRDEEGRGREAQDDRLRRLARAAVAAGQPGLDPRQRDRLQPRARPDHHQRARVQRVLDHRPRHHHGRGRRPHRRAPGQGRRPALSLGQSPHLPRRHQGRPDASSPSTTPSGSPAACPARDTCSSSTTADTGRTAIIRRSTSWSRRSTARAATRWSPERPTGPGSPSGATRRRRSRTSTRSSSRGPIGSPTATR